MGDKKFMVCFQGRELMTINAEGCSEARQKFYKNISVKRLPAEVQKI